MSDVDDQDATDGDVSDDELERIREQKKERLKSSETATASESETETGSPDEPVHVESQSHFEDVVAEGVVLVDFYADWCGPCKMIAPVVEDIAATTDATVAKVDVDAHQALAREYGVQGVPTLFLFVDGEATERLVGVQDEGSLRELVATHT